MNEQIQTGEQVMVKQPDSVVLDKVDKNAVVIDVAVQNNSNIRKEEHETGEIPGSDRSAVEDVESEDNSGHWCTLGCDLPKLEEWLQQIPGATSEISIQKSVRNTIYTVIHIKILHR